MALGVAMLTGGVVAPFPEEHPYNVLNPWIEPWWEQLSKSEQKAIYAKWDAATPFLFDTAEAVDAKRRALAALGTLINANTKVAGASHANDPQHWLEEDTSTSSVRTYASPQQLASERQQMAQQELYYWIQTAIRAKKAALQEKLRLIQDGKFFPELIQILFASPSNGGDSRTTPTAKT